MAVLALLVCGLAFAIPAGNVDEPRIASAEKEPKMWLSAGRDSGQTYHSPLTDINAGNVSQLGFQWEYRLETRRGLEATPIVVDGVMYTSGPWGRVYALDAANGQLRWSFDPHNDGLRARYTCCDFVNRGVAVWQGRVFVASLDGRLFALDAASGAKLWETDTIVDRRLPYTTTGTPLIAGGLVVIGNSGADIGVGGVRGYVTAYDVGSGALRWRFYTVPECGKDNPDADQARAQKTWSTPCDPRERGGGTVWDGMAYDNALKLVYLGVGNASPYLRKAAGSGQPYDDLYLSSIVALDARTGKVAWHYQTTPGEIWDYTASAKMILTDLTIAGRRRAVLMQAPKNGYFYVLDRKTGEVISAKPYTFQNWSLGMDARFRPIPNPNANYSAQPRLLAPSVLGGHGWQPMSFDAKTGLVYIPVIEAQNLLVNLEANPGAFVNHVDGLFSTFIAVIDSAYRAEEYSALTGPLPSVPPEVGYRTVLKAFDPIKGRTVWQKETWRGMLAPPGGVMSTAGGLVFQGGADGHFRAYDGRTGSLLKDIETGTAIMAAPMTYKIGDRQYVAVMAAWGGSMVGAPFPPESASFKYDNVGRILTFSLGGMLQTPKPPARIEKSFTEPASAPPPEDIVTRGAKLFVTHCSRCHVFATALNPDLRRPGFGSDNPDVFRAIVLNGALAGGGMGRFDDVLSRADADAIFSFVTDQRWQAFRAQQTQRLH